VAIFFFGPPLPFCNAQATGFSRSAAFLFVYLPGKNGNRFHSSAAVPLVFAAFCPFSYTKAGVVAGFGAVFGIIQRI
jgi:hypothetical protein